MSTPVLAIPDNRALYRAVSFPLVTLSGTKYQGPIVRWFVTDRPDPLDLSGLIHLDDETAYEAAAGEEVAVWAAGCLRSFVSQSLTSSEVRDLRAYLESRHRCDLYTTPVVIPVQLFEDGDVPALASEMAEQCHKVGRQTNDPRNGRISLHMEPGYDLPFKVAGYFQDVQMIASDYEEIPPLMVDE